MGTLAGVESERDLLKQEVERLTCELEQITHQKNLSAQYGLALLEEKSALQHKCDELESYYEAERNELEILREALEKYQTNQKATASSGIEQEESLLLETASKEASFTSTLLELEKELKQARQEVSRVGVEKERILQENIDLAKNCDVSEWEKRNYKAELKELKHREARLLSENNELEEENIALQKQISSLRSSQVEFEAAKHEVRCLQEEIEAAKCQIEELTSLKRIAEKQLEEALEALQSEREQKYALKKELDQRVNSESIFNINNMGFSGFGLGIGLNQEDDHSEDGDNDTTLTSLTMSINSDKDGISRPQSSTVGDLFSELHLSEIHKLEKQLETSESEKTKLSNRLQETQQHLEKTKTELNDQNSRVQRMVEHINALISLHGKLGEIEDGGSNLEDPEKDIPEISRLKHLLTKHEQRYQLAVQQVEQLQSDVKGLQEQGAVVNEEEISMKLRNEISELKIQSQFFMNRIKELEDDLGVMGEIAKEARFILNFTQEDLVAVSEELAQLYHHVCMVNGETPSRIMLDHVKGSHATDKDAQSNLPEDNQEQTCSSLFNMNSSMLDILKDKLKSETAVKILLDSDEKKTTQRVPSNRLLDTIHDQLGHLTKAVESTIEIYRQKNLHGGNEEPSSLADIEDLQEQVIKLKSLLSTKREQIATLRTVLKANKQTAEVAMANLKSKYENEKSIVSETMMKLRNELKVLKEDAATFASLRAMFAARCEEYVTQLDEMQRQLTHSDEQKRTLNSILKLSIRQKLDVQQKLEEYEMESKDKSHGRRHNNPRGGRNMYSRTTSGGYQSSSASAYSGGRHGQDGGHYHSRRDH